MHDCPTSYDESGIPQNRFFVLLTMLSLIEVLVTLPTTTLYYTCRPDAEYGPGHTPAQPEKSRHPIEISNNAIESLGMNIYIFLRFVEAFVTIHY